MVGRMQSLKTQKKLSDEILHQIASCKDTEQEEMRPCRASCLERLTSQKEGCRNVLEEAISRGSVSQEGEYDLNTQSWVDFPGKDILMWESLLQVSG